MWYKIIANYESGKQRTYEIKGLVDTLKMIARLKATDEVVYCRDKLLNYKILHVED